MTNNKQWQPIETAPRDGTIVRLKCDLHPEWGDYLMRWVDERWEGSEFSILGVSLTYWEDDLDQPTHWALPETPEEKR